VAKQYKKLPHTAAYVVSFFLLDDVSFVLFQRCYLSDLEEIGIQHYGNVGVHFAEPKVFFFVPGDHVSQPRASYHICHRHYGVLVCSEILEDQYEEDGECVEAYTPG